MDGQSISWLNGEKMRRTSDAFINVRMFFFRDGAGIAKLNGSLRTIVDNFGVLVPGFEPGSKE